MAILNNTGLRVTWTETEEVAAQHSDGDFFVVSVTANCENEQYFENITTPSPIVVPYDGHFSTIIFQLGTHLNLIIQACLHALAWPPSN